MEMAVEGEERGRLVPEQYIPRALQVFNQKSPGFHVASEKLVAATEWRTCREASLGCGRSQGNAGAGTVQGR